LERAKPQSNVMTALKALISSSRRLERFEGQKNMGAWRSSRAFETLMMRMLGLMAFSTTSGMGLLLLVKRNGDFGARTNLSGVSIYACRVLASMTSHAVCAQSHWMWNGRVILAKDKCAWNSFGRVALTSPLKAGRAADTEGGAHLECLLASSKMHAIEFLQLRADDTNAEDLPPGAAQRERTH
jgi:hypothetical protein